MCKVNGKMRKKWMRKGRKIFDSVQIRADRYKTAVLPVVDFFFNGPCSQQSINGYLLGLANPPRPFPSLWEKKKKNFYTN